MCPDWIYWALGVLGTLALVGMLFLQKAGNRYCDRLVRKQKKQKCEKAGHADTDYYEDGHEIT